MFMDLFHIYEARYYKNGKDEYKIVLKMFRRTIT